MIWQEKPLLFTAQHNMKLVIIQLAYFDSAAKYKFDKVFELKGEGG